MSGCIHLCDADDFAMSADGNVEHGNTEYEGTDPVIFIADPIVVYSVDGTLPDMISIDINEVSDDGSVVTFLRLSTMLRSQLMLILPYVRIASQRPGWQP